MVSRGTREEVRAKGTAELVKSGFCERWLCVEGVQDNKRRGPDPNAGVRGSGGHGWPPEPAAPWMALSGRPLDARGRTGPRERPGPHEMFGRHGWRLTELPYLNPLSNYRISAAGERGQAASTDGAARRAGTGRTRGDPACGDGAQ